MIETIILSASAVFLGGTMLIQNARLKDVRRMVEEVRYPHKKAQAERMRCDIYYNEAAYLLENSDDAETFLTRWKLGENATGSPDMTVVGTKLTATCLDGEWTITPNAPAKTTKRKDNTGYSNGQRKRWAKVKGEEAIERLSRLSDLSFIDNAKYELDYDYEPLQNYINERFRAISTPLPAPKRGRPRKIVEGK